MKLKLAIKIRIELIMATDYHCSSCSYYYYYYYYYCY